MREDAPRILVAGLGNIFLGDDGFGVEVVRTLWERPPRPGVRIIDFGIRGLDLVEALLDGYDLTILVDAARRGGAPGTLYTLVPEVPPEPPEELEAHGMDPSNVLALVMALGVDPGRLLVVGCEPSPDLPEEDPASISLGLSEPVARAVAPAAARVNALIQSWILEHGTLVAVPAPSGRRDGGSPR
ncbi:MAG TPA: hydrogenase maturation protease [Planctomycetota bacterium]|nr:hydrogenase maturation protease [Planctomycetota bacterium]